VKSVADYYYVIDKGTVVAQGSIDTLDEDAVKMHLVV
jgi:urea transport system ATP-binding protein